MSHIYWNKKEIPIPHDAYINHYDGRVFVILNGKRKVIGHATSETTMHPNDVFRSVYPYEWEGSYGKKESLPFELHAGMYALTLGAATKINIYPLLIDSYGPQSANAVMDYSMFSMLCKSDVTQMYEENMRDQVLFSGSLYSDSWYSDFFQTKMPEQNNYDFKVLWIKQCQKMGITNCWIAIDGSNNDCEVEESDLPEFGAAKSHNDCTIISYIYAVDSKSGMPITYFVYEGSRADCKAFQEIITFINGYNITVEGVLIDRGFCTHDVVTTCNDMHLDYIMMVPHDTYGHQKIMEECLETIRWDPEYLVDDSGIFGITREKQLFGMHPEHAFMNLYFSGASNSIQSIRLIKDIQEAKRKAEKTASAGKVPQIAKNVSKYVRAEKTADGYEISYDFKAWKAAMQKKGSFSIASGKDHGAQAVYNLYSLRSASEIQYGILKSQEGFDVTRVHFTASIYAKFQVSFITSCIRASIMAACLDLGLATNDMIQKMNRVHLILGEGGIYLPVKSMSEEIESLLGKFGLNKDSVTDIANDVNHRISSPINSQVHTLPTHEPEKKGRRGRKPGSKNRKTLEREAKGETKIKHDRPGRPSGSKDSKPRKTRSDKGKKRNKQAS